MENSVIQAAMMEMRRFIQEALAGRAFGDVPPSEVASIHDAADAHIQQLYGVRGWDVAAAANALRSDSEPSPDFETWKELYSDLEELAEIQSLSRFFVYQDYLDDHKACLSCDEEHESLVIDNVRSLLSDNPTYQSFEVVVNILNSSNVVVRSFVVKPQTFRSSVVARDAGAT